MVFNVKQLRAELENLERISGGSIDELPVVAVFGADYRDIITINIHKLSNMRGGHIFLELEINNGR